jgi:DNA-binding SARP family transcriptional activator
LEALMVDHPLRERVRGQLMLGLYRSGRHAALHAYRAARRELADELGLAPNDPGARFRWSLTGAGS